jgi:ATP-dependent RNA helicase DDX35
LGRRLSCFPYGVDPRIAAMLLKSLELECSWDALGAASALALVLGGDGGDRRSGSSAGMSSSSLLWQPPPSAHHHQRFLDYQTSVSDLLDPSGDHATYLNVLAEFEQRGWNERDCRERYLNFHALKRCREIRRHLASVLRGFGALSPSILDENQRSALVLQCVCAGFFFNVAKLGSDGRYYTLRRHIAVSPAPGSALSVSAAKATPRRGGSSWSSPKSQYIVFGASADGPRGGMELIAVSSVEARWLREAAPHYWDS